MSGPDSYREAVERKAERDLAVVKQARKRKPPLRPAAPLPPKTHGGDYFDPCSHVSNGNRIATHFGGQLLFVQGIGWHLWGPPWRHDPLGAIAVVQGLGRIIAREGAELGTFVAEAPDADERKRREKVQAQRYKWASESESAGCIAASMRMAEPRLCVKPDALDRDPYLLGLPGGVLDLRRGEVREHRQTDLITKTAGCDFDPSAEAPTFERFVAEAMDGDPDLIDYIGRLAGYMLLGCRGEHILPIFWGPGANGKSVFLSTLQAALGEYAGVAAPGLLMQQHGSEHPTGMADLQGKRLVIVSETGEGGRLAEDRVKYLTGGDRITARRMRENYFEFDPTHLVCMQTNHRPRVSGSDEGTWRRVRLVPWTVVVPPERRDTALPEKLRGELPGVLAWMVRGLQRYLHDGFKEPTAVKAATAEYRTSSDVVGAFLAECCEVAAGEMETAASLYRAYVGWCHDSGERAMAQREFGMRLGERGFERKRYGSGVRWFGLGLLSDVGNEGNEPDFRLTHAKNSPRKVHREKGFTSNTSVVLRT